MIFKMTSAARQSFYEQAIWTCTTKCDPNSTQDIRVTPKTIVTITQIQTQYPCTESRLTGVLALTLTLAEQITTILC